MSNYKDIQQWLNRGVDISKELAALRTAKEETFTKATKTTTAPKEVNVQTSAKTSNEHEYAKYVDYRTKIDEYIKKLNNVRCEILEAVQKLESCTLRTVIIHRYINGLSFSDISELMGLARQTVINYHNQALEKLEKIIGSV